MAPHQDTETQAHVDGRLNRSTKTRAAIVDALVSLIDEGNLVPTSEDVAARANVGLRTVFRHFEDMEALYEEVDQAIQSMIRKDFDLMPVDGPLEARLELLLQRRTALYSRVSLFVASTVARKWRSPFLQRSYKTFAEIQRTFLIDMLPEIAALDPAFQKAIDQLCSFDTWNRMHNTQGISLGTIEETLTISILALLQAENLRAAK